MVRSSPHAGPPRTADERLLILRPHILDGVSLASIAEQTGISTRSLTRWLATYRSSGPDALGVARRSDSGTHRLDPELVAFIEGTALGSPPPSITTITRRAAKVAAHKGWKPASYAVVRAIVAAIEPDLTTLAHGGTSAWRDKYELVWRRSSDLPNAMWQADHTELDILLRSTRKAPLRPWLTVVEDDHSRSICGYLLFDGAPSAMNTGLALRHAIWPKSDPAWPMCGIPDILYVDHGSDFTSSHLAQASHDLRMQIVYSTVARPQGRGKIERFFRTLSTQLLAELPGYLHPARGRKLPEPVLDIGELDDRIRQFIHEYNTRTHPEIKRSPKAAWLADGWLPRMPDTLESLDLLLISVAKPRLVQRDGIRFQGLRYLSPTLAGFVGKQVTIRYDPRDITEIRVFHNDKFVCKAVNPDHDNSVLSLKDIQAARVAQRKRVRSGLNERISVTARHRSTGQPPTPKPDTPRPEAKPKLKTYWEDR
ncbi:MAG: Mu transposase C-terminal domain-containing protein [Candidatus Nanopelagicales bacterium]